MKRRPRKRKSNRTIYRLECSECLKSIDGTRRKPKRWRSIGRVRSLRESRRINARPGETNFSLSDWNTHTGVCPDCIKENGGELP